jgi:multicomponent Na+:H+ antiporter subunit D
MKITLFMAAGAIFVTTHKKDITEMVGIGRRMPYTMAAFTVASVGIAGFPFFVGFVSKANIIMGAVEMGRPVFVATLIASALLALTYLMPVVLIAFKKNVDNPEFAEQGDAAPAMLVPLIITALAYFILVQLLSGLLGLLLRRIDHNSGKGEAGDLED